MSRNAKIILVVVGSLTVICILSCVAGIIFLPQLAERFGRQAIDPNNAKKVASEIADYTLPTGYTEVMGLDILGTKVVAIGPSNRGKVAFVIMLMQVRGASLDRAQMQQQLQQQMQAQMATRCSDFHQASEEKVTIKGQPVVLTISECEQNGVRARQEVGVFEGKGGTAMIMIIGSSDEWDAAALRNFFASIR